MAIRKIVTLGDDVLRKVCKKQEKFDKRLWTLLEDMADTMYKADGVGLAAPQVAVLKRVVVIDVGDGLMELVNPEIIASEGAVVGAEGCLSIPGKYGLVKRPMYAKVRAQDRDGNWFETDGEELTARCFCHELDHLDGILYTQQMERLLTEEELQEL